jgi:hypothetical protein
MAFRSSTAHIDTTLELIGDTTFFDSRYRPAVQEFALGYLERLRPNQATVLPTTNAPNGLKHFQSALKTTGTSSVGTSDERAMRQAMHFLWQAMGHNDPADLARRAFSNVRQEFQRTMWKALCVADDRSGLVRGPSEVFAQLRASPLAFLKETKVQIDGSTAVDQQLDTNVLPFVFRFEPELDRYRFESASKYRGQTGKYIVSASSVPGIDWQNVPGRGANPDRGSFGTIRGTHLDGDLMLTSQLTGCTICVQAFLDTLCAAHVKPGGAVDGTALARQLAGTVPNVAGGAFSNAPLGLAGRFLVFGRGFGTFLQAPDGYDARLDSGGKGRFATMLGLRGNGSWHLYLQENFSDTQRTAHEVW